MFESIDDSLADWAASHRLSWTRLYRDQEVRSIDLFLAQGRIAQIWIEPAIGETWKIQAWDRKQQKLSVIVAEPQLGRALSDVLAVVKSWTPA